MENATQLEEALNQPDRSGRLRALRELKALADAGAIRTEPPRPWVNMHCHSFHSYNAHGFSPSRIAWEAHRRGLAAAGVVDFDVLDGLDETLAAGDALRSKLTMGIETRVYIQDFARDVINSPNEPGISYFMGQGFVQAPPAGSPAARTLQRMKDCSVVRNRAVMENVNRFLGDVAVDYARDVLPLTASGNATERHLLLAYDLQAQKAHARPRPPREILGRENPDAGAGSRGADERSGPFPRHAPQAPDEVRRPRLRAARPEEFPHAGGSRRDDPRVRRHADLHLARRPLRRRAGHGARCWTTTRPPGRSASISSRTATGTCATRRRRRSSCRSSTRPSRRRATATWSSASARR